jgi:hypothetical protein
MGWAGLQCGVWLQPGRQDEDGGRGTAAGHHPRYSPATLAPGYFLLT